MNKKLLANPVAEGLPANRESKGEAFLRRLKKDTSANKSRAEKEQRSLTRKQAKNNSFEELTRPAKKPNPKANPSKQMPKSSLESLQPPTTTSRLN